MTDSAERIAGRGRSVTALLGSNLLDSASRRMIDLAVEVVAVTVIGASAFQIGILNALGTLSFMLLGIPIGVVIDRIDARLALMWAGAARSAVCLCLAFILTSGSSSFALLAVASVLIGVSAVVSETAQTVYAARTVAAENALGRLVGRMQSVDSAASLVVPAAGGIVLTWLGANTVVVIGAAFATAASIVLVGARHGRPEASEEPSTWSGRALRAFWQDARAGLSTLVNDPVLRRLTWWAGWTNFGLAVFSAIETILFLRTFDLGTGRYGILVAVGAAGGLIGSVVAELLGKRWSRVGIVLVHSVLLVLVAATMFLPFVFPELAFWIFVGHGFMWGFLIVVSNVHVAALVAMRTDRDTLGRVVASRRAMTMGVVPVGAIFGGAAGDWLGAQAVVGISVAASLSASIVAMKISNAEAELGPREPG